MRPEVLEFEYSGTKSFLKIVTDETIRNRFPERVKSGYEDGVIDGHYEAKLMEIKLTEPEDPMEDMIAPGIP